MSILRTEVLPFKATAFKDGDFINISEADLRGKWSVVFFYPADFTFVCPTELEDLAEHYEEFQKRGVEIYSVSTDTHFTHMACTARARLSARSASQWWATPRA